MGGGTQDISILPVSNADLMAAAGEATIANTVLSTFDDCNALSPSSAQISIPAPVPPPISAEVDYSDLVDDFFPYQPITIVSPPPYVGDVTCFVPGIGQLVIPVVAGWQFEPDVFVIFIQRVIMEHCLRDQPVLLGPLRTSTSGAP